VTRDRSLDHHTSDAQEIRRAAGDCLKRVPLDRRLRLLGVRVGAVMTTAELLEAHADDGTDATSADRTGTLPLF
jgi:DNA polymerase-4